MIKEVINKKLNYLELTMDHPINEFGEFIMVVSKWFDSETYIFSIHTYNWVYRKKPYQEIIINYAPIGFNHPQYKSQLIAAMNQSIEIIMNFD
ncbi:hypothetical protein ACIQ34_06525 [Ureibacillus sp. NPDC094379]